MVLWTHCRFLTYTAMIVVPGVLSHQVFYSSHGPSEIRVKYLKEYRIPVRKIKSEAFHAISQIAKF